MIYGQSNFDHALGVVPQVRVSGGNRTHDLLAHYPLDYQATFLWVYLLYCLEAQSKKVFEMNVQQFATIGPRHVF